MNLQESPKTRFHDGSHLPLGRIIEDCGTNGGQDAQDEQPNCPDSGRYARINPQGEFVFPLIPPLNVHRNRRGLVLRVMDFITLSVQGAIRLAGFENGADCVLVLDLPPASLRPAALPAPLSIPRQVQRSFPEAGRVQGKA